ncbi:MAG TPA: L-serine ammonia-lyase, iron-sulfur-dependent, subunit alpha [Rectinemataceae bacterium]|nr:L-serine ammonia-lyase, iron-sulfur-dependent, subunit alpha [Rectinemataceae bacterium]
MNWKFTTAIELFARIEDSGLPFPDYLVERDAFYSGSSAEAVRAEIARRIRITRDSIDTGASHAQRSFSGMTDGAAVKVASSERPLPVGDELFRLAIVYSLAGNEVNACGGKIVAFPTAGSSGIVPGCLWAWRDARARDLGPDSRRFQDAFVAASAVGMLIAARATLAGAAGGCQAECGAAAAMAAAGLCTLMGMSFRESVDAAALSLKNSLGLACDPVAGLVEVPCVKRNAFMSANALTAATLAAAGVTSAIPFDEVVGAMKAIGDSMPASLKESAEGGLAATPTGLAYRLKIQ